MSWVNATLKAIWALFVDDAAFAALVVGWLALTGLFARVGLNSSLDGALLFCGLGLILVHGAMRKTRSR
jgi:hypothetical protein